MHKTITHEAAEMCPNQNLKIRKFRHYRLALEDIGGDLHNFSSMKGFVKAIRDAIIGLPIIYKQERMDYLTSNILAHDGAFYEADVLHRDISVGNVVILEDGTGLLADWDLCKVMNSASANEGHAIERTVSKHHYLDI